jgi:hypothetical protein
LHGTLATASQLYEIDQEVTLLASTW